VATRVHRCQSNSRMIDRYWGGGPPQQHRAAAPQWAVLLRCFSGRRICKESCKDCSSLPADFQSGGPRSALSHHTITRHGLGGLSALREQWDVRVGPGVFRKSRFFPVAIREFPVPCETDRKVGRSTETVSANGPPALLLLSRRPASTGPRRPPRAETDGGVDFSKGRERESEQRCAELGARDGSPPVAVTSSDSALDDDPAGAGAARSRFTCADIRPPPPAQHNSTCTSCVRQQPEPAVNGSCDCPPSRMHAPSADGVRLHTRGARRTDAGSASARLEFGVGSEPSASLCT